MHELKTYSVQISEYIKRGLLEGKLRPGDKVNEVHLASALSISRAPVREALQMLVKDGLIVSIPQRGKFIRTLTAQDIRENYSLSGVLEGAAAASCIDLLTESDFARLEDLHGKMADLDINNPEYAQTLANLDINFHDTLVAKASNKLMVEYARSICPRLSKFLLFHHWPEAFTHAEVVERHGEVLQVVKSRSAEAIEKTLRAHYSELGERMAKFGCDAEEAEGPCR